MTAERLERDLTWKSCWPTGCVIKYKNSINKTIVSKKVKYID